VKGTGPPLPPIAAAAAFGETRLRRVSQGPLRGPIPSGFKGSGGPPTEPTSRLFAIASLLGQSFLLFGKNPPEALLLLF